DLLRPAAPHGGPARPRPARAGGRTLAGMALTDGSPAQTLLALMPFAGQLGIELDSATPEEVVGRMAWAPDRCTAGWVLHGGALIGLADSLGAVCAFLNLPEGAGTATISSSTNLLRAV